VLLHIKTFDELTTNELYAILRLRAAVFVVEQNCVYQDLDDKDQTSLHLFLTEGEEIIAYARVIPAGVSFPEVAIGRVISTRRRQGLGTRIVREAITVARERFHAPSIVLEAQVYARSLYEKLGFCQTSEVFLEDGIPHIQMKLDC